MSEAILTAAFMFVLSAMVVACFVFSTTTIWLALYLAGVL